MPPPPPPARLSGRPEIERVTVNGAQVRNIYLNGLDALRLVLGSIWSTTGTFEPTPGAKNPKNPITADLILGTRILGRSELVSVQRSDNGFHVENKGKKPIEARLQTEPDNAIIIPPGTSLDIPDNTILIVQGMPLVLRSRRR